MKTAWIFVFFVIVSTASASVTFQKGKLSASVNSMPLNQVIDQIRSQSKIEIVLEDSIGGQPVSGEFQNLPVGTAIRKLLEGTGVNFVVVGNQGEPKKVFIGMSEKPGAPARRLDNRPTSAPGRGVVTPVNPPLPPPNQPQIPPLQEKPDGKRDTAAPPVEVPTGGGFVPNQPNQPGQPNPQRDPNAPQNQEEQQQEESDEE